MESPRLHPALCTVRTKHARVALAGDDVQRIDRGGRPEQLPVRHAGQAPACGRVVCEQATREVGARSDAVEWASDLARDTGAQQHAVRCPVAPSARDGQVAVTNETCVRAASRYMPFGESTRQGQQERCYCGSTAAKNSSSDMKTLRLVTLAVQGSKCEDCFKRALSGKGHLAFLAQSRACTIVFGAQASIIMAQRNKAANFCSSYWCA